MAFASAATCTRSLARTSRLRCPSATLVSKQAFPTTCKLSFLPSSNLSLYSTTANNTETETSSSNPSSILSSSPSSTTTSPSSSSSTSTSTTSSSSTASDNENFVTSPDYRMVAAAVVQRTPLLVQEPNSLERSFYKYQRQIQQILQRKIKLDWYYKEGSPAMEDAKTITSYNDLIQTHELNKQAQESIDNTNLTNLERHPTRTLYLLVRKNRKEHSWQFPQGGVEGQESLVEAAERELFEECGPNLDIFSVGKVPAACLEYDFPQSHKTELQKQGESATKGAKVFFQPFIVLRGKATPNKKEGLVEHAWLTREEIKEKVHQDYWEAISPILGPV